MPSSTMLHIDFLHTLDGHQSMVFALCSDTLSTGFWSASGDGWIIYWEEGNYQQAQLSATTGEQIMCLSYDDANARLLVGTLNGHLLVIDIKSKTLTKKVKIMKGGIFAIECHELGCFVVGDDGCLTHLHPDTFYPVRSVQLSNSRCRAIYQDEQSIYVGTSEGKIFGINPWTMKAGRQSDKGHVGSVFSLIGSDESLISGGKDGKIIRWDYKLQQIDCIQAHGSTINSLVHIGATGLFASGCRDGSIRIWDTASLEVLKVIDVFLHQGHLRSVNKLLWLDGRDYLVSGSDDRKVKVWSIR